MYKFLILALFGVFVSSTALADGGGIGTRNVNGELRTFTVTQPYVHFPTLTTTAIGTDGMIARTTMHSGLQHITLTSSIGQPQIPAKLMYEIVDQDTVTGAQYCRGITIVGLDQFGAAVKETHTGTAAVTEFSQQTTHAFAKISSIALTNCNDGTQGGITTNANDFFAVWASMDIGLPCRISSFSAVEDICFMDSSASNVRICAQPGAADTAAGSVTTYSGNAPMLFDNAGAAYVPERTLIFAQTGSDTTNGNRVDKVASSVYIGGLPTAIANGDAYTIRVRCPAGVE